MQAQLPAVTKLSSSPNIRTCLKPLTARKRWTALFTSYGFAFPEAILKISRHADVEEYAELMVDTVACTVKEISRLRAGFVYPDQGLPRVR